MRIIGNNQFRITANSAINKFIIVRIIFNKIIEIGWTDSS